MSQFFMPNVQVKTAERPGNFDRYGRSLGNNLLASNFPARLEQRTIRTVGVDGRVVTIDGTIDTTIDLEVNDRITLKNGDQWEIFNIDENLDILGNVLYRTYGLVKQRKKKVSNP